MAKQNTDTAGATKNAENFEDDTASAAAEKNDAQALIRRADLEIEDLNRAYSVGMDKVERKNERSFNSALDAMYAAIAGVEESGTTEEFLTSRGIDAHGNTRNKYFLLVRAFADSTGALVRGKLCKEAQRIALARLENVAPADFGNWKKYNGIERACKKLRAMNNEPRGEKQESPEPKVDTRGLTGDHPAIVRFPADGSKKKPRLIRIMSREDLLLYAEAQQHVAAAGSSAQNS